MIISGVNSRNRQVDIRAVLSAMRGRLDDVEVEPNCRFGRACIRRLDLCGKCAVAADAGIRRGSGPLLWACRSVLEIAIPGASMRNITKSANPNSLRRGFMSRSTALLLFLIYIIPSSAALADSCTAIPDNGPLPAFLSMGSSFSGPVVEVIDGDSLCVAVGPRPEPTG